MTRSEPLALAVVGADPLQETALTNALKRRGLLSGALLTFGTAEADPLREGGSDSDAVRLPLDRATVSSADAVFLFSGGEETRQPLTDWARGDNFWLLDLSEEAPPPWVRPQADAAALKALGPHLSVPSPEAWCAAALTGAIADFASGPAVLHVLHPASTRGEAGVRELFRQSADALNFRKGPTEVLGRTVAFNLFPEPPDPEAVRRFAQCVRALGGGAVDRLVLRAPLYHGALLSLCVPTRDPAGAARAAAKGLRAAGFTISKSGAWPGALDEPQGEGIRVRLSAVGDHLWAWFVYDQVNGGRAPLGAALLASLSGLG